MSLAPPLNPEFGLGGRSARLGAGARLYRQGEVCPNYFVLMEGWLALSTVTRDGAVQILDFAVPGHVLGLASAAGPMRHTAQCLTAVRVQVFARTQLAEVIGQHAHVAQLLVDAACVNEARAHQRLVHLGLRDARERVAQLLVDLYLRITGHLPAENGETLLLPLTQRHIAQASGLSGEHVNRTLRRLREQGILHFTQHRLRILDAKALLAVAGRA